MKKISLKYILVAFAFIAFVCYEMNEKRELEEKILYLEGQNYDLERAVEDNEEKINQLEYDISDVRDEINNHQEILNDLY